MISTARVSGEARGASRKAIFGAAPVIVRARHWGPSLGHKHLWDRSVPSGRGRRLASLPASKDTAVTPPSTACLSVCGRNRKSPSLPWPTSLCVAQKLPWSDLHARRWGPIVMAALADNLAFIICNKCRHAMNPIRTVPRYREFAELQVFVCCSCGEVQTKEAQPNEVQQQA
jgi:hypothetical protein